MEDISLISVLERLKQEDLKLGADLQDKKWEKQSGMLLPSVQSALGSILERER